MERLALLTLGLTLSTPALAEFDASCAGAYPTAADYDEQVQVSFLQNYNALATSLSAVHAPIPHEGGHGAMGIELAVLPPLGCKRRVALGATKTENTNVSPIVPKPRVTFAFPGEKIVPYGGFAFVPPVPIGGVRTSILSGEVGVGVRLDGLQVGGRLHATAMKTVGDVATPFSADEPSVKDVFQANTWGLDAMVGMPLNDENTLVPYLSVGWIDVTTFFWIGDDGVVSNNLFPYFGPAASLGVDGLVGHIRWGAELYAAPGGRQKVADYWPAQKGFGTYGHLYTARVRAGWEF